MIPSPDIPGLRRPSGERYRRTPEGWKFSERVFEVRYFDTTPLPGSPIVAWAATGADPLPEATK
jgi:hypothetical protein